MALHPHQPHLKCFRHTLMQIMVETRILVGQQEPMLSNLVLVLSAGVPSCRPLSHCLLLRQSTLQLWELVKRFYGYGTYFRSWDIIQPRRHLPSTLTINRLSLLQRTLSIMDASSISTCTFIG